MCQWTRSARSLGFFCLFVCLFFQQCACQIPKWCGHLHYQSRGFETSQDLMIIRQDFTTGVHCIQPVCLSARTSASPRVRSVAPTVLGGFFLYLAHIITSIRGTWNDSWPGPISSRSFSRDSTAKLLKHGICCPVRSTTRKVLDGFLPYLAQIAWDGVSCTLTFDLDLYLQGHSAMT